MDAVLSGLEQTAFAQHLRFSRWSYAAVNAAHIAGIALLFGSITAFNIRLLGFQKQIDRYDLARLLLPLAVAGLSIAILSGFMLFSIRAGGYADLSVFRAKMLVVFVGATCAIFAHLRYGLVLQTAPASALKRIAVVSIACWATALLLGRLIAFTGQ